MHTGRMGVTRVQGRTPTGDLLEAFLLDNELALLSEGWCPYAAILHWQTDPPEVPDDGRLQVSKDGWAVCSHGLGWRVVMEDASRL